MKPVKQGLSSSCFVWFVLGFLSAVFLVMNSGAGPAQPQLPVGTYQIETADGQGVYLLDTRTGQLWLRSVMVYYDLGTPQAPVYKSTQLER